MSGFVWTPELFEQEHQRAFTVASKAHPAHLARIRRLIDHSIATGVPYSKARIELEKLAADFPKGRTEQ